jgi:DNA-binding transcriptional MerR regulator
MKIGQLAKLTNASTKTIRFYEDSGLLPLPARSASGYRDYGPEIVDRLRFIHRGQAAALTLQQVRQILAIHDRGEAPCAHVRQLLNTRLDQVRAQIAEVVALEGHLQSLLVRASLGAPTEHDQSTVCWILESDLAAPPVSDSPSSATKTQGLFGYGRGLPGAGGAVDVDDGG